ncbi:MAG: MFS transporter [Acidobacteriota bacterium]|nr:MFS transporter [Acidobacteriota bacterium]
MVRTEFYGWKLLGFLWAIVFANLAFPIYGASVVNAVMVQDLDFDRGTLGSLVGLFTVMSGLPGPLVAVSMNRFGVRNTLVGGSLLVVAGSVAMATVVRGSLGAMLAFGVVVGAGVAAGGVIGAQAGLARWFVRRRALVLAVISTASGVGGFMAAPLLNRWIDMTGGGWRMGWWAMAGLSALAAAVAFVFVKERPEDLGQQPDGGAPAKAADGDATGANATGKKARVHRTAEEWSSGEALAGHTYWLMMFCQMGMSCGYTVFLAHGIVHLQDSGHTREIVAWAPSLMAFAGLFSKGIIGAWGDRIDPRYIWAGLVASFGVGIFLLADATSVSVMIAAASCMGLGFGGGVVCLATVVSNYYGVKPFAVLAGVAVAINTTLGSVVPPVTGLLYDKGHGYEGVFYVLAGWCAVGAILLTIMRPPFKKRPA